MGHPKNDISHEVVTHHRMQVVYSRKMHERQVFMDSLKAYRKRQDKRIMREIRESIGPKWYQALSVPQRTALDSLEFSIYQDILEGLPKRTRAVIKTLGVYPVPHSTDLMSCVYLGRKDPKDMLAQLFLLTYGHPFDVKRSSYDLNARLMLSGILYIGFNNLIHLLRERFRPAKQEQPHYAKPKAKIEPPLASPYLQKVVVSPWTPAIKKRKPPAPLPNLEELDEPYEEDPPIPKPAPPPPPPPPPKKPRLSRAFCDKVAGIMPIEPYASVHAITTTVLHTGRKHRGSKQITQEKKVFGMSSSMKPKSGRRKRPTAPSSGMWNTQYMINGVYTIHGKTVYILGSVAILPSLGELIHGGYRQLGNEYINIHCGFRGKTPPPIPDKCDCGEKWTDTVFQYLRRTKCYCGHHYDYGNEGIMSAEDLPFFQKPTRHSKFQFNYSTIFDLDPKSIQIGKEFKKIWDTDSMLHVDDETQDKDKKKTKKKKRSASTTCLGDKPKPEDYLKCALRLMRRVNIAASLPDVHLVPELREWMRQRLFGPLSKEQKSKLLIKSYVYWSVFQRFALKGYPHIPVPQEEKFTKQTTWNCKELLNKQFSEFLLKYKLDMYRAHADFINMMWPSMYQAQFPDKKFREIFFSYLSSRIDDIQFCRPYSTLDTAMRISAIKKRYICLPAGAEDIEH